MVRYFGAVLKELFLSFTLSECDAALWQSNRFAYAQDYLLALPIEGLNKKFRQFRSVLCYRFGILLFEQGELCPSCSDGMDIFGDHAMHCSCEPGLTFRHDIVRDTIIDMYYRASVSARKETALGLLSDEGADLRPADILVYSWDGGLDVCMDVTRVSPFTGEGVKAFKPGQALDKAIDHKKKKYLEKCTEHVLGLGVLAFTTLGELGSDAIDFMKRLRNYIHGVS